MFYENTDSLLFTYLFDVVVKITLLLLACSLFDVLAKNCSAALRHRTWATAIVAVLLLPFISFVAPDFRLAILPVDWSNQPSASQSSDPASPEVTPSFASQAVEPNANAIAPISQQEQARLDPVGRPNEIVTESAQSQSGVTAETIISKTTWPVATWFQSIAIVAWVWFVGFVFTISPLLFGIGRVFRLRRESPAILESEPVGMFSDLRRKLGIRRNVQFLETQRAIVPMTWGILRPVVLIPSTWRKWAVERRRLVVLHELAHIKRMDVIYQSIARVVCSIYWFHPLVWYALKRLRVERELACDDCVLMAGELPSNYAQQLLSIAVEYQSRVFPPAVAMAQRSGLENRVRSLLDQARSHVPLTPRVAGGMVIIALTFVILLASVRLDAVQTQNAQANEVDTPTASRVGASNADAKMLKVSGVVTADDGKPLEGVRVTVLRTYEANISWEFEHERLIDTTTDAEGRYQAEVPAKSDRFSNSLHFEQQAIRVFASKEGYGPDEVIVDTDEAAANLKLARATQVIEGRLVDLEGKPIQGAKVRLMAIEKSDTPIETWLEQAKNNPATFSDPRMMMAPPVGAVNWPLITFFPAKDQILAVNIQKPHDATSDASGKFTLAGVGDDRQATLQIESPTITTAKLHCVTHDMPAVNMPSMDPRFRAGKTFGTKFEYSVEPTQWIQGTVRDKKTGAALPDVVVSLMHFGDSTLSIEGFVQSKTDEDGRYVLKGIPKAPADSEGIRLRVLPTQDQPYFRHDRAVPKSENLDPIQLDFELTPGVWIEGQVTDATSKSGLPSMVAYYPHRDNPNAKNHEAWNAGIRTLGYEDMFSTDIHGHFRVPGMSGQGLLRVVVEKHAEYESLSNVNANNVDAENIVQDLRNRYYHIGMPGNALHEVDVAQGAKTHRVEIDVKPLDSRTIRVVDAAGNDVTGYRLAGRLPKDRPTISGRGVQYWEHKPIDTASTLIFPGNTEEQKRPLIIFDADRAMGAVVPVASIANALQPEYRLSLQPCVTLTGKLVDGDGKPISLGYLQAGIELREAHFMFPTANGKNEVSTAKHPKYFVSNAGALKEDGTFECVVPPGKGYCLVLTGGEFNVVLLQDRDFQPGQRVDLGTIDVSTDGKNWPEAKITQTQSQLKARESLVRVSTQSTSEKQQADLPLVFKGKVAQPDGAPAVGASLHFVYYHHGRLPDSTMRPAATTDVKGEFEIRGLPPGNDGVPPEHMALVASKQGFGIVSLPAILFESTGKLASKSMEQLITAFGNDKTLRLVPDDQPLQGRILTVEGRPVQNAQIRIMEVGHSLDNSLDLWEKAALDEKADYYSLNKIVQSGLNGYQLPSIISDTTTDKNGNFTLKGIGRERVVTLLISGPSIETATVHARTRNGKTVRVPHQFGHRSEQIPDEVYYPATFDFVALPSVPVEGRIVDDTGGKPLAGFLVTAGRQITFSRGGKPYMATLTDKDGRYRLTGLSQSTEDMLYVVPPRGSKYLPLGVRPKTNDAREAITMDFKMKPVALLRGNVKDTTTGKPITGAIQYSAMTKNPNLDEHRTFAFCSIHECRTDENGHYEIAVLPGEGVVTFQADDHTRYRRTPSKASRIGDRFSSPAEMGMYEAVPRFVVAGDKQYVKQLQIDSSVTDLELDIELTSGVSLQARVVRANGEPAKNAIFKGTAERSGWYPTQAGAASIEGYYADQGREIFAYDLDSGHATFLKLSGPQSGEILIKLQPAGTIRGRLVDKQGIGLQSLRLLCESIPEDNSGNTSLRHTTDKDGKFELKGVVPGFKHTIWALIESEGVSPVVKDLEVDPTKVLDLGNVTFDPQ